MRRKPNVAHRCFIPSNRFILVATEVQESRRIQLQGPPPRWPNYELHKLYLSFESDVENISRRGAIPCSPLPRSSIPDPPGPSPLRHPEYPRIPAPSSLAASPPGRLPRLALLPTPPPQAIRHLDCHTASSARLIAFAPSAPQLSALFVSIFNKQIYRDFRLIFSDNRNC